MSDLFFLASVVIGLTIRVPRAPLVGETLVGDSFDLGPGGKGLNQAIAARRQGAAVALIGAVGDDLLASVALQTIDSEGLDGSQILRLKGIHTGVGFVTLDAASRDNTIVIDPGANLRLTPDHVKGRERDIAQSALLVSPLELPTDTVTEGFCIARRHGVKTLLNPAPARPLPAELLAMTDLLTPNEVEARMLLGLPPDDTTGPETLGRQLIAELGVGQIVMTLGRRGAMVFSDDGVFPVAPIEISAVDPTGAGDCFNATLAVGVVNGMSLVDAAHRAAAAGAYCAGHLGVIGGLPTTAQLDAFILSTTSATRPHAK